MENHRSDAFLRITTADGNESDVPISVVSVPSDATYGFSEITGDDPMVFVKFFAERCEDVTPRDNPG